MAMTSAGTLAQSRERSPREHGRAIGLIGRAIGAVRLWRARRHGRRELAFLDDRSLRDIAMTRLDAARECRKRFWQQ